MVFIKTDNREAAYRALINQGLKDKTKYCNYCGLPYHPEVMPCCEDPQIGTNYDHTQAVIFLCKEIRETRKNKYGSTDDKSIRNLVSIPNWMYYILDNYEKGLEDGCRLFKTQEDVRWFAKTFPAFATVEVI
jgi:hypothetical protein